jgi:hypothetical protein
MANSLNRNLTDCLVVLGREHYPTDPKWNDEASRTVFVSGGFGANADTSGNALYVRDRDGKSWRAEGYMVERFIREVPEDERQLLYVVTVMSTEGVESYEMWSKTPTGAVRSVIQVRGWDGIGYRMGEEHDDALITVEGVDYVVSPKKKGDGK